VTIGINEWKELIVAARNKRFGDPLSKEERWQSFANQLEDVAKSIRSELGDLARDPWNNVSERVSAAIGDLFLLADDCDVDLEEELQKVIDWFSKNTPHSH
jgi:hypothetical protein